MRPVPRVWSLALSEEIEAGAAGPLPSDDPLTPWLDQPEAMAEALARGERPRESGFSRQTLGYAYLRADRLGAALVARDGSVLHANEPFLKAVGAEAVDPAALAQALDESRLLIAPAGGAEAGAPAAMAYGPVDVARNWRLPDDLKARLDEPGVAGVVLAVATSHALAALNDACASFGMTPAERRVVSALILTGNLRDGAERAGLRYDTARKMVGALMRRLEIPRQQALVEKLLKLSLGVWPAGREGDAVLTDTWGLTPRQGALAYRVAVGMSREEAARAAGVSEAVAKKELSAIFETLGVTSASALTRFVTEARALSMLTDAVGTDALAREEAIEPLRLIPRPAGGQVALSDYGPRSGRPVLVLHSSSSSRPVSRRLLKALHARRWRPIAIDRPGFGLTDPLPGPRPADPFTAAVDDIALVLETLRIARLPVIARGGAQVALALARERPDLIEAVVLVNPDPPTRATSGRQGVFEAVKRLYLAHPDLIERFAHTLANHVTIDRARNVIARVTEGSPIDQAAMADPLNYADFVRGIRMFTSGRVAGYIAEQVAMTRLDPPPLPDAGTWTVLQGAQDSLHDAAEVEAYWRRMLPGATYATITDGGRFIAMTHAEAVVAALEGAGA